MRGKSQLHHSGDKEKEKFLVWVRSRSLQHCRTKWRFVPNGDSYQSQRRESHFSESQKRTKARFNLDKFELDLSTEAINSTRLNKMKPQL